MAATATILPSTARITSIRPGVPMMSRQHLLGLLLLMPAVGFLLAFFVVPAVRLFVYSVLTQGTDGVVALPLTLSHLRHFFTTSLYTHVLGSTLRMAAITGALAALLRFYHRKVYAHPNRRAAGHPDQSEIQRTSLAFRRSHIRRPGSRACKIAGGLSKCIYVLRHSRSADHIGRLA